MCCEAYRVLAKELLTIGLEVNPRKTVTTSLFIQQQCSTPDAPFQLDTCPKVLGAYVGRTDEEEKQKLHNVDKKHQPLFERLPSLPTPVSFRLLTSCAALRYAHLIRSHNSAVTNESSTAFTERMLVCAAQILGVDRNEMSDEVIR